MPTAVIGVKPTQYIKIKIPMYRSGQALRAPGG
jgi:hypothetical protein